MWEKGESYCNSTSINATAKKHLLTAPPWACPPWPRPAQLCKKNQSIQSMKKTFTTNFFSNPPFVKRQHLQRQLLRDGLDGPGVLVFLALRQGVDLAPKRISLLGTSVFREFFQFWRKFYFFFKMSRCFHGSWQLLRGDDRLLPAGDGDGTCEQYGTEDQDSKVSRPRTFLAQQTKETRAFDTKWFTCAEPFLRNLYC